MTIATRLIPSLLATLTGCGLVHLQTSTGAAAGGSSLSLGGGGGNADRILAAFRAFDYHRCGDECGGVMRKQAGIALTDHVNPKSVMKNPAPDWITGWDKLPDAAEDPAAEYMVFGAMTLASSRAKWQGECEAHYTKLDAELRAFDAEWQAKIDAAHALDSFYARASALAALSRDLVAAEHDKPSYEGSLRQDVGARDAIEHALRAELAASPAPYVYHHLRLDPVADFDTIRPRGTVDQERTLFCAAAFHGKVATMPPPPSHGLRDMMPYVKLPVSADAIERAEKLAATNRARNTTDFGAEKDDSFALRQASLPAGVVVWSGKLAKVDRAAHKLVLETSVDSVSSDNCKSTNRISAIRNDGHVEYDQNCDMHSHTNVTQTQIALTELPAPEILSLTVGDQITVLGTEVSQKSGKGAGKRFGDSGTVTTVIVNGTIVVSDEPTDGGAQVAFRGAGKPATVGRGHRKR